MGMKPLLIVLAVGLAACAEAGDPAEVTVPLPPTVEVPESTTSTGAIATTTTTQATTTTTVATTTTIPGVTIDVAVAEGAVTGGGEVAVPLGEAVTLRVTSDVADEIHVHTYDLYADVEAGGTATLEFVADVPGVHEIELESAGLELVSLEVGG